MAPLRVRLSRSESPGATVRLLDAKDRTLGLRQLGLAENFSSQGPPETVFRVAPGSYKISVLLTGGEVKQKVVTVGRDGAVWSVPAEKAGSK